MTCSMMTLAPNRPAMASTYRPAPRHRSEKSTGNRIVLTFGIECLLLTNGFELNGGRVDSGLPHRIQIHAGDHNAVKNNNGDQDLRPFLEHVHLVRDCLLGIQHTAVAAD